MCSMNERSCSLFFQYKLARSLASNVYTAEPVYNGHPWDNKKWLLQRGGHIVHWSMNVVNVLVVIVAI